MNKNLGITLLETVISIALLAFSFSGAVYLTTSMIHSSEMNQKRVTALYLAQECAELVRNVRDSSWKQNLAWNCAFNDGNPDAEYRISVSENTPLPAFSTDCKKDLGMKIEVNPSSFQLQRVGESFVHSSDPLDKSTIFNRKIRITDVSTNKMTAQCEVSWKNQTKIEKVEIVEVLTNWQKK